MLFTIVPFVTAAGRKLADHLTRAAVEAALGGDLTLSVLPVHADSQNGIVILTGRVDCLLFRERAVRIAATVRGVRAVVDRLEIVSQPVDNDHLRARIVQALRRDRATEAVDVKVAVDKGVVTVSGAVDSWAEKILAERTAKGVLSVGKVNNALKVPQVRIRADSELRAEIDGILAWDVWVDHTRIEVKVVQGVVHLSGVVGSEVEKSEAVLDSYVQGVPRVDSRGGSLYSERKDSVFDNKKDRRQCYSEFRSGPTGMEYITPSDQIGYATHFLFHTMSHGCLKQVRDIRPG